MTIQLLPTVLVYRSNLLPKSETFIKEQVCAYRQWRGLLVGRRLLDQLSLDGLKLRLLDDGMPGHGILQRLGFACGLDGLRQERPSLLHAHFGPEAVSASPIARALRVPMVVTLHGYDITIARDWWESGKGGGDMRSYPRRLLQIAAQADTHFVAVSDAIRARAIAYGIAPDKVTTIPIGIDVTSFTPGLVPFSERPPRVLFVGRLVEKKGCRHLLRAMAAVRARIPGAELVLVGDGPLRAELEKLSGEMGGGVRFAGALPPERVKFELNAARVFCLPSVQAANGDAEGFGLVLLEAQASGLPVISSALGGAREGILHGESGYRVEEGDIEDMAERLIELLAQPDKAAAMGAAGRRFVCARFDIRDCTRNLERHYNQLARIHDNEPADAI
jgi:glycosyltransferase involved in cell wall biosynthesis